jgi:3-hydroxyacyl-CoA dehydrogenase/enoyl-CoA hydratase/3-hydroxybutyryl-CoA epimerase
LACDYRLVFDKPSTQLGLPEVQLGLLPGWGGTQRLPRVVGLEPALQMILGGKRLSAIEASKWGLADAVAGSEAGLREQFAALKARAIQKGKVKRDRLPLRTWRQKLIESTSLARRVIYRSARKLMERRVPEDMPAPGEAFEAIRTGVEEGLEAGFTREREAVSRLAVSPACRHLIGVFFAREEARKLPTRWQGLELPEVKRIGVVGGGVMGAGIAQLGAFKGCEVVVQEINESALGAGIMRIGQLFEKAVDRRLLTPEEAGRRLSGVRGTTTWEDFDRVDLVVEAAVEDLAIKQSIFRELEARTSETTVLATNTSSLSVAALQEGLAHPERVAGLHFFNPVHKMPLVEVAHTERTDDRTRALLTQWTIALDKTPVQALDSPGFIVNRVLMPYLNEAVVLIEEGLSIEQIDRVMKRFGMPLGPLELLDQVGLDVAAHVAQSMKPVMQGRFPPSEAFEKMRRNGWLGQKGGKGFYDHSGKKRKANTLAENLLRSGAQPSAVSKALSPTARQSEAKERMVLLMVNEAAMVLGEKIAESADAIDLAMIMGTGWAPHRGGPLHYARTRSVGDVVYALQELAARYGSRFNPCAELIGLAGGAKNQPTED